LTSCSDPKRATKWSGRSRGPRSTSSSATYRRPESSQLIGACGDTIGRWHQQLTDAGIAPNEARRCDRARELIIDRTAGRLAAHTPEWLTDLIGPRPTGPHDASVWDHAVRTIAEQRATTGMADAEPGFGIEPTEPAARLQWQTVSRHVLEARTHLDNAEAHRDLGPWPLLPSRTELDTRLAELDVVLASAPPDQRDLISRLRDGNQLTLLDTTEALNGALETQGARRDWILANWPHVVEYAEITRSIGTRTYGPELDDLRSSLRRGSDCRPLLAAIEDGDVWVDRALCRLVGRTATTVGPDARAMLEEIAEYRSAWSINDGNPIGSAPRIRAQAADFGQTADRLRSDWGVEVATELSSADSFSLVQQTDTIDVGQVADNDGIELGI
jgi:hypothetical protein